MKWVFAFLAFIAYGYLQPLIAAPMVECSNKKTSCYLNKSNNGFALAIGGHQLPVEEIVNTPDLLIATSSSKIGHLIFILEKNDLSGTVDINIKNQYNTSGLVRLRCKETTGKKLLVSGHSY